MQFVEEPWDALKARMVDAGWKVDLDDEDSLQFSQYVDENWEWYRDYNKKTNTFVQYNARMKIRLWGINGVS